MAHFAQLDSNNVVVGVIVVHNDVVNNLPFPESEPLGIAFCKSLYGEDTIWKQTSYNANFRGSFAGMGSFYFADLDVFSIPKPFPSWSYSYDEKAWVAPIPKPDVPVGYMAVWDEEGQEWDIVLYRGIL